MKVKNPSGREYYIQRAKDDRMANWCSRVTPVLLEFDGVPAEAYADPDRSDWIYIRFNETTYCNWAKKEGGFDLLTETTLRVSDRGRTYRKRDNTEGSETGDGDEGSSFEMSEEDRSLGREDLDTVVLLLPTLREAIAARADDANTHEYSAEFSEVVRKVVGTFHKRGFMYPFDYMSWMKEADRLTEDREALAEADLETIRKLLVVHWRRDYWDSDNTHWEFIAASGHLGGLLERLAEIAGGMEKVESPRMDNKFTWSENDVSDITFPEDVDDLETEFVPPGVERYAAAFEAIRDKITDKQILMLQAHYNSGGRAVTMRELATASGYGDYKIANIQYGSLAKRLLKAMAITAPIYNGGPIWVLGIADLVNRAEFGLEWHLVMRQEVARALEDLEIV